MRGRDAEARKSLGRLTGLDSNSPDLLADIDEIKVNLETEKTLGTSTYLDCFKFSQNKIFFRTLTGIFIQAWQQLTGSEILFLFAVFDIRKTQRFVLAVNFIFYYGTTFFAHSGISNPFLVTVATGIVNVFMTLPGMYGIERFGRRRLLLIGAAGMSLCEFIIAIVGVTVSTSNLAGQRVLIAFVCIYIVSDYHWFRKASSNIWCARPSLHPPGAPLLGSLLAKYSPCRFVQRPCHFPLPATGFGTLPSVTPVSVILCQSVEDTLSDSDC
jgi:MFS family permease